MSDSKNKQLLQKRYRPEAAGTSRADYHLSCAIDEEWEGREQRVLILLETIDGQDLAEKRLLSNRSGTVVRNLLQYSMVQAKKNNSGRASQSQTISKNFVVTNPKGEAYKGRNLKEFCLKHGLGPGNMSIVCRGIKEQHKGWTGKYTEAKNE